MTENESDESLVQRARAGDHGAFGHIVTRYQHLLMSVARAVLGISTGRRTSWDDTADAVQDALVLAFLHLNQLQDPARLGPWLRRVTANCCRSRVRSLHATLSLDVAPLGALASREERGATDTRLVVEQALGCLSQETRLTVELFYQREMSVLEIAAFQEVPVTTIKSRLRNARLRLRKELDIFMEETMTDLSGTTENQDSLVARVLRRIQAGGDVSSGTLSPDGAIYVTAAALEITSEKFDARVSAWQVPTGDPLWSADLTSWFKNVLFTPDGRHVVVSTGLPGRRDGKEGRILFLDASTGEQTREILTPVGPMGMTVSPDGTRVAAGFSEPYEDYRSSGYKGLVRVYDLATGAVTHTFEPHRNHVSQVAFSPDGKILASSALLRDADPEAANIWLRADVRLWDLETGALLHTLERPGARGRLHNLDFSPDGLLLAAPGGEEGETLLWNPDEGALVRTLPGFDSPVYALAFSRDGKTFATGDGCGRVRLFSISGGELITTLEGHDMPLRSLAFTPDGTTLLSADMRGAIRFWRLS